MQWRKKLTPISAGTKDSPAKRLAIAATTGRVIANEAVDLATNLPPDFPRLVHGCKQ